MNISLLATQCCLIALGLLGMSAAKPENLPRHLMYAAAALMVTFLVSRVPSKFFVRYGFYFWLIIIFCLVLALFIGNGPNGVKRWIPLGPIDFQPSEFAKIALIAYLASFFMRRGTEYNLIGPIAVIGLTAGLVLVAPSASAGAFIFLLALAVMFAAGVGFFRIFSIFIFAAAGAAALFSVYINFFPYVGNRLNFFTSFVGGNADPQGSGFQNYQALRVLVRAGPLGLGPDWPMIRLPFAHTDFMISSVAHAAGLFGVTLTMFMFFMVLRQGLRAADVVAQGAEYESDPELHGAAVLAAGATILLVGQAVVHFGVAVGMFPNTGMALPMMSWGGSNMIVAGVAFGWIQSALKQLRRDYPELASSLI